MDDDGEQGGAAIPHAAIVHHPIKAPRRKLEPLLREAEERHGWATTRWYATDAHDSGVDAALAAAAAAPAVVLVAGGDGTLRVVAATIGEHRIPIALVPSGTGNLLARNLGLPLADLRRSVETAFSGVDRPIDLAIARLEREDGGRSTHPFLVMAGIGLDASMAANTNASLKRMVGWAAYVDPIARSILGDEQLFLHYRVNEGRARSVRAHTVIVGNCGTLTANLLLLPDAVVDDGLLDVALFRPRSAAAWARIGSRLSLGGPLRTSRLGRWLLRVVPAPGGLHFAQARRFDVRFRQGQTIQLDGDDFGQVVAARITVEPGGVLLRMPASA
ncbi:NAD(+)/NADH kinase [Agrococcus terreus]|uniref:diacylglycerol/lipid kinase family protein n=1 Tax=Agrococcus terreus TaxID=574649 RepID=UPI00384E97EB